MPTGPSRAHSFARTVHWRLDMGKLLELLRCACGRADEKFEASSKPSCTGTLAAVSSVWPPEIDPPWRAFGAHPPRGGSGQEGVGGCGRTTTRRSCGGFQKGFGDDACGTKLL